MSGATAVKTNSEMSYSLFSQCMDYTKHLVSKNMAFKFSLSQPTGSNFSMYFSLDKLTPSRMRGKSSASTLKRNSLRKKQLLEN